MSDVFDTLAQIAAKRAEDPLKPVTVIAPSHAAALHLRRRLAAFGPFAAVRFETLPRVAELLGAGRLAADGKSPLARPIGDYLASEVARESREDLAPVGTFPGYGRTLRQIFRRLRRAGVKASGDVHMTPMRGHLSEVLRLYDRFREEGREFYDPEDLQEAGAAAVVGGASGVLDDLGEIYIVPPGPETDSGNRLLDALSSSRDVQVLGDPAAAPEQRFVISPDPASEARAIVRQILRDLEAGIPLHEIAVFHGADESYGRLLREAFDAARVPCVPLPGIPLVETRAGRGVLMLGALPQKDYSRTATIELLSVAPIREWLPTGGERVHEMTAAWDKISREAGITHGAGLWRDRLDAHAAGLDASLGSMNEAEHERRIRAVTFERDQAANLRAVIDTLLVRLEPLLAEQPAEPFISNFKAIVNDYLDRGAPGFEEVSEEIDQLGTVGAVGGSFSLATFLEALRANLTTATMRPNSLGNGVVVADYRVAAGMRFQRVYLCGAYEGAFPAGPGSDALLDDAIWRSLKEEFPYTEDVDTRIARARAAVGRAVASTAGGVVTWSAPAHEPGGAREYYPSPLMAEALSEVAGRRVTATELRGGRLDGVGGLVARSLSPLSGSLRGVAIDYPEVAIRRAVLDRGEGRSLSQEHPRWPALEVLRARRSDRFTEWDGNLAALSDTDPLMLTRAVSPTSLEQYAACGFRYFARSILRLNVVEEPDDRDVMAAVDRGSLMHEVLDRFFQEQHAKGRPAVGEPWNPNDSIRLLEILDEELDAARERGLAGLPIYARHEARNIRADLQRFLEEDSLFRQETGAVPTSFEQEIPEQQVAGVTLRGRVDRIDQAPDGTKAWVIDYKTGKVDDHKSMDEDPFLAGRRLQLPVYISAVPDASEVTALYWFITQRGGFDRDKKYEPTDELEKQFQATIEAIVSGVRSGAFPPVPGEEDEYYEGFKNCGWCDYKRICSQRRDAEYAAKQGDARMQPWHAVGEAAAPKGGT